MGRRPSPARAHRTRELLEHFQVNRLEERPCRICHRAIGNRILAATVCSRAECQRQRVRDTNRRAHARYRARKRAAIAGVYAPDPIRQRDCNRCGKPYRSRNRALCPRCYRDPNRMLDGDP